MLTSARIDLWYTLLDEARSDEEAYLRLMSEAEHVKHQRFVFAKDRHRYLVTRALVRTVLSRYANITPEQWIFSADEYGKPHIANDASLDKEISFNITHTDKLVVVGVTHKHALGVDVENWRNRKITHDVAEYSFAPIEVADLRAQSTEDQPYRFFEYWTLKEAYIKARGMGLSIPLDQFHFHFPSEDTVSLAIEPTLQDKTERWRLWQFVLESDYLVSICAEKNHRDAPQLILNKVVPLVSEQSVKFSLTRFSKN